MAQKFALYSNSASIQPGGTLQVQAGAALAAGDVVYPSGSTLVSGVTYLVVQKALATNPLVLTSQLFVMEAAVLSGALGEARLFGLSVINPAGSPAVLDPVYVSDTATLSLTAGTYVRTIGQVVQSASGLYRLYVASTGAQNELPDGLVLAKVEAATPTISRGQAVCVRYNGSTTPVLLPNGKPALVVQQFGTNNTATNPAGTGAAVLLLEHNIDGSTSVPAGGIGVFRASGLLSYRVALSGGIPSGTPVFVSATGTLTNTPVSASVLPVGTVLDNDGANNWTVLLHQHHAQLGVPQSYSASFPVAYAPALIFAAAAGVGTVERIADFRMLGGSGNGTGLEIAHQVRDFANVYRNAALFRTWLSSTWGGTAARATAEIVTLQSGAQLLISDAEGPGGYAVARLAAGLETGNLSGIAEMSARRNVSGVEQKLLFRLGPLPGASFAINSPYAPLFYQTTDWEVPTETTWVDQRVPQRISAKSVANGASLSADYWTPTDGSMGTIKLEVFATDSTDASSNYAVEMQQRWAKYGGNVAFLVDPLFIGATTDVLGLGVGADAPWELTASGANIQLVLRNPATGPALLDLTAYVTILSHNWEA
jgi:hypothetical protein